MKKLITYGLFAFVVYSLASALLDSGKKSIDKHHAAIEAAINN